MLATSPTVCTACQLCSAPQTGSESRASNTVEMPMAMMKAKRPKRVLSSSTISPSVNRPMIVVGMSILGRRNNRSSVRATLLLNGLW